MIAREASVCQPTMPLAQGIDIDRPRRAVPAPHVGSDDNEPQQEGFTYMNPQERFSRINDKIAAIGAFAAIFQEGGIHT